MNLLSGQQIIIKLRKNTKRYYHCSPSRHKPGDIISGNQSRGWLKNVVYMTNSPEPHFTIADDAIQENWFVYEVLPLYPVRYESFCMELVSEMVEVVKIVGTARGLSKNGKYLSAVARK